MMWEGQVFPMVLCDGDQLPEAFHSEPGLLPHLHADHESRYPRAAVKHCLDDLDPPEDLRLEQRGIQLGKAPQRYTPLPSVKEKTDTFHGSLQSMTSFCGGAADGRPATNDRCFSGAESRTGDLCAIRDSRADVVRTGQGILNSVHARDASAPYQHNAAAAVGTSLGVRAKGEC